MKLTLTNHRTDINHNIPTENATMDFKDMEGVFIVTTDEGVLEFDDFDNAKNYYKKLTLPRELWNYSGINNQLLFSNY